MYVKQERVWEEKGSGLFQTIIPAFPGGVLENVKINTSAETPARYILLLLLLLMPFKDRP
jgi:hypothetical protein